MEQLFDFLISKVVKVPKKLVTFIAILLVVCWYIFNPLGQSYVVVASNPLTFDIPPFHQCKIVFQRQLKVHEYTVYSLGKSPNSGQQVTAPATSTVVEQEEKILLIENSERTNVQSGFGTNEECRVVVDIESPWKPVIESVFLDNNAVNMALFAKENLKSRGECHRLRYIREDLSDWIYALNDFVSNFVLAGLFFGFVALFIQVASMSCLTYLFTAKKFTKYLTEFLRVENLNKTQQRDEAFDKFVAHWAIREKRFHFLQAVGPALGFILTVSSLIAALHPTAHAGIDLDTFMVGLHVAMVSTFLGLLLRIFALLGARVNGALLHRAYLQLSIDVKVERHHSHPEAK